MTDTNDKVAEARARTQKLAAGRLVRRQELEAELAGRKRERAELETLGPSNEALALARDLDARIQDVAAELATVEGELQGAQRELANLRKLGGQAEVARTRELARSVTDPDPILRSPEEQALDNVRSHVADLEAQLRTTKELGAELGAEPSEPPVEPPTPAPGDKPKKTL